MTDWETFRSIPPVRARYGAVVRESDDPNNCTCDLWPDNEPHCHLGALVED